ncbi:MAG TPA: serine/threonine-protein kinase, partial [Blastocatellia bacterium]|nr:serine/threonine-protein kinase [Blastocatellia bacterium]
MGEVFLAEDTKLGRKVAVKFLNDKALGNEQARKRLIREAKAAATLDHPNICTIHEVNDEGENPFIVMQYIEGETLAQRIKNRSLEIIEAVDIAVQVTEALAEAHSHRIIHRDIKPQNVIVTGRGQVKVLDFGLAKILAEKETVETEADTLSQLSETGQVIGTVGYMSPEQLRGERVDSRTDLFSLGVLLYNCATGKAAFTGSSTMEICLKVVQTEPPRPSDINPGVPPELESIIIRAMAKDAYARYSSADDMLQDLLRLRATLHEGSQVRTRSISHQPASLYPKVNTTLSGHLRRKPLRAALLAAPVLLLLIVLFVLPLLRGGRHQPSAEATRWYETGVNDIGEGAYYKATQALERAIALDNRYALAHARLAEAYMEMDYSEKAKAEMLTARSLLSDRAGLSEADALYMDAIGSTVNLKFAEAVEHYQKIADQAPESGKASAYLGLGRSYEKTENIDRAIELYQEAARLDPQSAGP